jgi:hypothetical protein
MLKSILAILSCALLLSLAACNSGAPADPAKKAEAPAAPATTPVPDINYGEGFSALESTPDGATWRWMAESGNIQLKNKGTDMRLLIKGTVPTDSIKGPVKLTLKFNGEPLEQLIATPENATLEKEFTIPAAKQTGREFSQLTIESDKFFIPKLVDKQSTDDRKLSFSLTKLEWTAK